MLNVKTANANNKKGKTDFRKINTLGQNKQIKT